MLLEEIMRRLSGVAIVLFFLVGVVLGRAQQRPAVNSNEPLALTNANVVNVRDGRVTANATIVLRAGRIESVGSMPAPASVRTIDLKGKSARAARAIFRSS